MFPESFFAGGERQQMHTVPFARAFGEQGTDNGLVIWMGENGEQN